MTKQKDNEIDDILDRLALLESIIKNQAPIGVYNDEHEVVLYIKMKLEVLEREVKEIQDTLAAHGIKVSPPNTLFAPTLK